jgi:murein DD-endopeptidase MepM/ murein hydrolase activator NlpD
MRSGLVLAAVLAACAPMTPEPLVVGTDPPASPSPSPPTRPDARPAAAPTPAAAPDPPHHYTSEYSIMQFGGGQLRVILARDGDHVSESIANEYRCAITLDPTRIVENLREDAPPAATVTIPAGKTVAIAHWSLVDPHLAWKVKSHFAEMFGDTTAKPAAYAYALPFSAGETYPVGQGFAGTFSHTGDSEYAVDFTMPEGTAVRAARDGVVVATYDQASGGGTTDEYKDRSRANWIYILHSDGTLGMYWHLAPGGVKVAPGDQVARGDVIASSGFTGYAQVPHLHFAVVRATDGTHSHSFKFAFKTSAKDKRGSAPVEGQRYTAFE